MSTYAPPSIGAHPPFAAVHTAARSSHPAAQMLTAMTQVLRWSALATGLFYGAYTQLSISARERVQAEQKAYSHKESLIRQAKAEWARQHPQEQPKAASGGT